MSFYSLTGLDLRNVMHSMFSYVDYVNRLCKKKNFVGHNPGCVALPDLFHFLPVSVAFHSETLT